MADTLPETSVSATAFDAFAATRAPIAPSMEPQHFTTRDGDLGKQWQWHGAFRDAAKNMYTNTSTTHANIVFRSKRVCGTQWQSPLPDAGAFVRKSVWH